MGAPGTSQPGDFGVHQFAHDLQADRGRGGQQPLGHVGHKRGQVAVQTPGKPLWQAKRRSISQP